MNLQQLTSVELPAEGKLDRNEMSWSAEIKQEPASGFLDMYLRHYQLFIKCLLENNSMLFLNK